MNIKRLRKKKKMKIKIIKKVEEEKDDFDFKEMKEYIFNEFLNKLNNLEDINNIINLLDCLEEKNKSKDKDKEKEEDQNIQKDEIDQKEVIIDEFLKKLKGKYLFTKEEFFSNNQNVKISLLYKLFKSRKIKNNGEEYYKIIEKLLEDVRNDIDSNIQKKNLMNF